MQQSELKHTLAIRKNAWFVRFYTWLYKPTGELNFCKLFWGLLLSPLVLTFAAIGTPIYKLGTKLEERRARNAPTTEERVEHSKKLQARRSRRRRRINAFVDGVAGLVSRAVLVVGPIVRPVWSLFQRLLVPGAVVGAVAGSGLLVYLIVANFSVAGLVLAGIAGAVVLGVSLVVLHALGVFEKVDEVVVEPAGHGVKTGVLGFAGVIKTGFRAVKTNTCPRIELR